MTNKDTSISSDQQRLNKFVALCLGVSRRKADSLIEQGKILVNQQPATLGSRVSMSDQVSYNGKLLTPKSNVYLLLHKPTGYVCSRRRQGDTPTIYELLPDKYHHLKPVGRLDKDSSGLIILTNDGDFAFQMTHPSFKKSKRYLVTLDTDLQPLHQQMISYYGVTLPDGPSKLTLTRQHEGDSKRWIVEMSEGRNRQIRRTFDALGYKVTKLHRTDFGNYSLGDISRGSYEIIDVS